MINHELKNQIKWLFIFICLQVIFVNKFINILSIGLIIPLFIIPLIWLPLSTNKFIVLTYAFCIGFVIDILTFTLGIHSSIMVGVAFVRHYLLGFLSIKDNYTSASPSIIMLGFPLFIIYIGIIYLIFFMLLTILEFSHLRSVGYNIASILFNTAVNIVVVLFLEYFRNRITKNMLFR